MAQGRSKAMMANIIQKADSAMDSAQAVARTSYRETEMEHLTRRARGFYDVEARLPNIRPQDAASDKRPTEATNLLSYLGPLNPFAKQITENDTVWLLDNTAYRNPETNQWEAEFVAAVFDKNTGMEVSTVVADIAEKIGLGKGDTQEANIRDRLMPFMQSILPGRVVKAQFGRHHNLKLGPGGRNAISNEVEKLPDHRDGDVVTTIARVPQGANGILEMKTVYAEPEGWGVISDIDDSIKITQTSDPIGILHTTFASKPTPIAGMPELYAYLQTLITTSAPFFYLSASPYNLYPFLSTFRQQYYPQGTMILRDASWMNLSGLLSNLTLGTQDYKDERMTKIHSWVPKRKMICVGDSTQSDPEAYGDMYRKYPGWVHLILIRKVTDIAAIGIDSKNEPERFEKAFKGVPTSRWHLFTNPEECYQIINDIVQSTN